MTTRFLIQRKEQHRRLELSPYWITIVSWEPNPGGWLLSNEIPFGETAEKLIYHQLDSLNALVPGEYKLHVCGVLGRKGVLRIPAKEDAFVITQHSINFWRKSGGYLRSELVSKTEQSQTKNDDTD